ncbi:hypothetical protein EZV62_015472 [Acer yangbiense]|uniref:RNase H type-1 domain-containing protein n=1 Tax=Acer yangbiense TaxID=1000413 RepID=A0A5C7HKS7_9ROSI|nr:hypothetical protein EZV62_015472 [Acer yangbiense]
MESKWNCNDSEMRLNGIFEGNEFIEIVKVGFAPTEIGVMIRNDQGGVVATLSRSLLGAFSANLSEFLALKERLLFAKRLNLVVCWVEVDVVNVVTGVKSCGDRWPYYQ